MSDDKEVSRISSTTGDTRDGIDTTKPYGFKICLIVECSQKNGKIENTGSPTCGCGNTTCDAKSGMFCFGSKCAATKSADEDKFAECLNLFDCVVESIFTPSKPSVGWGKLNVINSKKNANPLSNLIIDKTFYFTHSFGVKVSGFKLKAQDAFSYSPKGSEDLVAAIFNGNIIGFQFHPEKSGQHGISLLSSTINYLAGE